MKTDEIRSSFGRLAAAAFLIAGFASFDAAGVVSGAEVEG